MRSEPRFRLVNPGDEKIPPRHRLVVIGVGGCGGNTVRYIQEKGLRDVGLIAANTDVQALRQVGGDAVRLTLRNDSSRGHGAGSDPSVGEQAARDSERRIAELLEGADMAFIAAGMGGGTGTGAAPVIAEIARNQKILTVAVVTRPLVSDGAEANKRADWGIDRLHGLANSLIVVPNQRLMDIHRDKRMEDIYREGTAVLYNAVQGIADMILKPGLVNIDFGDVVRLMSGHSGFALMGTGAAEGKDRDEKAINEAIRGPLLEDVDLNNAHGLLVNVAGDNPSSREIERVNQIAAKIAAKDAVIKCGVTLMPSLGEELRVTLVATGIVPRPSAPVASAPRLAPLAEPGARVRAGAERQRRAAFVRPAAGLAPSDLDYSVYEDPALMRKQSS